MLEKEKVMELKILNKQGQSMKAIVRHVRPASAGMRPQSRPSLLTISFRWSQKMENKAR